MHKKSFKPSTDNNTNVTNVTEIIVNNGSVTQINAANAERIDFLKMAIDEGNYNINPIRVAEKFIQFEAQLSA